MIKFILGSFTGFTLLFCISCGKTCEEYSGVEHPYDLTNLKPEGKYIYLRDSNNSYAMPDSSMRVTFVNDTTMVLERKMQNDSIYTIEYKVEDNGKTETYENTY